MSPKSDCLRYNGSVESLAAALHIHRPGDFQYHEGKGPLDKKACKRQRATLKALRELQANLAFAKRKMELALEHKAHANHKEWKLSPEDQAVFKTVVASRVRNMCYHVRLALSKPAVPK